MKAQLITIPTEYDKELPIILKTDAKASTVALESLITFVTADQIARRANLLPDQHLPNPEDYAYYHIDECSELLSALRWTELATKDKMSYTETELCDVIGEAADVFITGVLCAMYPVLEAPQDMEHYQRQVTKNIAQLFVDGYDHNVSDNIAANLELSIENVEGLSRADPMVIVEMLMRKGLDRGFNVYFLGVLLSNLGISSYAVQQVAMAKVALNQLRASRLLVHYDPDTRVHYDPGTRVQCDHMVNGDGQNASNLFARKVIIVDGDVSDVLTDEHLMYLAINDFDRRLNAGNIVAFSNVLRRKLIDFMQRQSMSKINTTSVFAQSLLH